jgi:WD40 repeat protein
MSADVCHLVSGQFDGSVVLNAVTSDTIGAIDESSPGHSRWEVQPLSDQRNAHPAVTAMAMNVQPAADCHRHPVLASATMDGQICLWELLPATKPNLLSTRGGPAITDGTEQNGHCEAVRALAWARLDGGLSSSGPSADILLSGSFDGSILIWKVAAASGVGELAYESRLVDRGCEHCTSSMQAHRGAITAFDVINTRESGGSGSAGTAATSTVPLLASAGEEGFIKVWDLGARDLLYKLDVGAGVCALSWLMPSSGGGGGGGILRLAAGLGNNDIAIHALKPQGASERHGFGTAEASTDTLICTMRGHTAPVHALLYLATRGWLVSGSADGSLRVWRVMTST